MPDIHPRASKFLRLDDGTKIPLDDAVEKAKSCPAWSQWCGKGVLKIAGWYGLPGLSKQQAARWLLSMGSPMELWHQKWEHTHKIWGHKPEGADYMKEICNELQKREPLWDEILEHVKAALAVDAERAKGIASAKAGVAQAGTVDAPVKARRQRHPQAAVPQPRTSDERNETIKATMLAILKDAKADNLQPPNENDIYRPVNDRLEPQGIHVTRKEIRHLWKDPSFKGYKLEPNQHWKGWDHLKG